MSKVIKVTENALKKIISQTINEMDWRTTRKLYNQHSGGEHILFSLSSKIESIIDEIDDNQLEQLNGPIRKNVEEFISVLGNYKTYFDRKISQIDKFDQHSQDGFRNEFGKSAHELENELGDKEDKIFQDYMDGDDRDEYRRRNSELEDSPEQKAVNDYYGY